MLEERVEVLLFIYLLLILIYTTIIYPSLNRGIINEKGSMGKSPGTEANEGLGAEMSLYLKLMTTSMSPRDQGAGKLDNEIQRGYYECMHFTGGVILLLLPTTSCAIDDMLLILPSF